MLRSIVSRNPVFTRGFRTFAPALVKAGQAVPTAPVHENSPGNSVNLAAETAKVSFNPLFHHYLTRS